MCGRFALLATPEEARAILGYIDEDWFPPRYNVAPTQPVATVLSDRDQRRMRLMRWGLVPAWVKEPRKFSLLINARGESLEEKPAFRGAIRYRRCLIPASGFYEWQKGPGKRRQPFWVRPRAGGLIAFAGLYESWLGADGSEIDSAAIVTIAATPSIAGIHDRMPVVIRPEDFERWLGVREFAPRDVQDLIAPPPDDFFEAVPVGDLVNAVRNEGPALQERAAPAAPADEPDDLPLFAVRR